MLKGMIVWGLIGIGLGAGFGAAMEGITKQLDKVSRHTIVCNEHEYTIDIPGNLDKEAYAQYVCEEVIGSGWK